MPQTCPDCNKNYFGTRKNHQKGCKATARAAQAPPAAVDVDPEVPEGLLGLREQSSAGEVPPETVKPWEVQTWTRELIDLWREEPEFIAHAATMGMHFAPKPKEPAAFRLGDSSQEDLVARVVAAVMAIMERGGKVRQQPSGDGLVWVEFPEAVTVEVLGKDAQKRRLPVQIQPINLRGRLYQASGNFTRQDAEKIKEELAGARLVQVPYNAAFVSWEFQVINDRNVLERQQQMFVGPVYAPKSMADALERQIAQLAPIDVPHGEIVGGQTKHDDITVNGVRFVTGYTYLVPPLCLEDIQRIIRNHERAFQNLFKPGGFVNSGDPRLNPQGWAQAPQYSSAELQERAERRQKTGHLGS